MNSSPDSSTVEPHSTAVEEPEDVQLQQSSQEPPSPQDSQPTSPPSQLDTHTSPPPLLDTHSPPPAQLDTHSPPPSQPTPPPSHLPTFITALSLKPRHPPTNGAQAGTGDVDSDVAKDAKDDGPSDTHADNVCPEEEKMDTSLSQESLAAKFKQGMLVCGLSFP